MINKKFESIAEYDLKQLIINEVNEKKTLEYKSELSLGPDRGKKEFLADVSSMANTVGGDLIFGITEGHSGKPTALKGIRSPNIDAEILKIESIIRDGMSPRISNIQSKGIKLSNGNYALVVRVPNSMNAPHRVIFKGHDKFYSRSTNGKYPMDVDELRRAFLFSDTILKEVEDFREERIFRILSSKTPYPIDGQAKIIVHVIPLLSFKDKNRIDLKTANDNIIHMKPIGSTGWDSQYNILGIMTFSFPGSYCQLFKNGTFELVNASLLEYQDQGQFYIPANYVEDQVTQSIESLKKLIAILKYDFPIHIYTTFVGVKDYKLQTSGNWVRKRIPHHEDILNLTESVIIGSEGFELPMKKIMRSTFDSLFHAYGYPERAI